MEESSVHLDATFFSVTAGTAALGVLSNQVKSRLALRRLHYFAAAATKRNSDDFEDESEDDEVWSDAGSSSSGGSPKPAPVTRVPSPNLYYWNRPRLRILDLPLEIIEQIALSLRESKCPMDVAALFISDKYSDFSETRFHLSALSRTCSSLRSAVERILYRNIQLDFTGWKGRKHTAWPAGSLRLLLRTLKDRPELGRYIYVAALDFQLSSESEQLEKALEEFLTRAPNLNHLFLSQCPVAFWDFPVKHLVGFATAFAPGILPSVLADLPSLKNLHLRDSHVMALHGSLPSHNLQRVRLDSSHEEASSHFARVLTICGNSVHDLDVRFIGGLQLPAPRFLSSGSSPHTGGSRLRTLRLDNVSVLSHLSSWYAQILRALPVLERLHVSHHAPFATGAFSVLPVSLVSLTASSYYGLWAPEEAKDGFLAALARCVATSTRDIARIEGSSGKGTDGRLDLQPVVSVCKTERIRCEEIQVSDAYVTVFFGSKVSCKVNEEEVEG